ncbi:UDP-N-acetylmuramoylalanine--D-glutamate ligase [Nocardiopsis terrae]|uniref:UDP-N-acetylmuramoylalanine--D-glutamate ligase n=1 Tax=Nocardiopsis terrae TaxID=372655 RepID=A0ABR9HJJ3_9ACTN|nr:UDP-N-acetylmuramoyl-L-alanine--D-glutamate ligase [Nocardiopsis terrae]MBE1459173.1 UDP-N-acetylmuramoylalanine--D-glutamate ligase [Nocardiopsis terrae]GHC88552.1 UDP-N-acetylmuramoylalanine--D-glutamate ligase [Nocardiopsis terrae]
MPHHDSSATPRSAGPAGGPDPFAGARVCVAGLGVSGPPVARALLARGARVVVVDGRDDETTRPVAAALTEAGAEVVLGDTPLPEDCGLVVTSPGWRPDSPLLTRAAEAGIEIIGDVELAWRLKPADQVWLAITGTNGKTTTVRMLESILRADGRDALAVGNVGTPVVEAVLPDADGRVHDILAVELSSFQLHWSNSVRPHAATVLNIASDHLDWHGGLEPYARAKGRVFARGTIRVVNTADDWSVRLAEEEGDPHTPLVGLRLDTPRAGELGVVEDLLVDRAFVEQPHSSAEELATLGDVRPAAPHNVANALAAAALARSVGVAPASVRAGLVAFVPEPHRIAHVASVGGVDYVDDSKATNPHAAAASLNSYASVVWIAGGLLKGAEVDDLVAGAAGRLRGAVLIGADRERIREALAKHAPDVPVVEVEGPAADAPPERTVMDAVVAEAVALAEEGDTVLLAPAAASMDMFTNYPERGRFFAEAVHRLG